ncbi:hypothetical protein [Actinokineospora fastidiosa]|uniref:Uncharacterized protein n=1 Tax=Actinokineospora fastidiosa TaxID=1816 RepID=A0A918L9Q4_9PSEU|nr:hypothetical protein [Actinokineospora fastidiosa]GGS22106.1 hypothetical protein GCM10010171_13660 [Actinokineospora fastidiosa]
MNQAALASRLAFYRAVTWGLAVSGDRLTRLTAPPWRADPYRTYADLRSGPAVYRSRAGMAVVSTHEPRWRPTTVIRGLRNLRLQTL